MSRDKFVEVKALIASKNKKLARWMPGFVLKGLENIIHQEEVNDFMSRHQNDDAVTFCTGVIEEFNINIQAQQLGNIPDFPERCLIVANHPLAGLEAIAMIHLLKDIRPDITFIVNDFLLNVKNLQERFVGVNKVGRSSSPSLQKVEALFASDKATCLFPSGLVSRKINGNIEDLPWKKTFVSKSIRYDKSVVPVYIEGQLSSRFYRLAKIRELLGIKFNFEMLFLVDEFYKLKGSTVPMIFGQPIPPETFTKEKKPIEWAQWTKDQVYSLKSQIKQ